MQLSDESAREYQTLYERDFGEAISFEEAREIATRLVTLYAMLRNPLPEQKAYADESTSAATADDVP
jgi:hypothetical protein